jgi:acyl-CoA synthetase (AMP-forming)/AMP-acid ligase II
MRAKDFREELRSRLKSCGDRIVLRILASRSESELVELTASQVLERSMELADRYLIAPERGVVLLLLPHSVELFLLHIGLVLRGRIPAILPWPTNRVDPEKYQRNLLQQLRELPASLLVTPPALARNLEPCLPYRVTACSIASADQDKTSELALVVAPVEERTPPIDLPEDTLFLQFSSGTTANQKCIVITADMLERHLRSLARCLDFGPCDGVSSWLPLYHDMGLIACLWLPLWSGAPSVHFSAQDWLMDPGMLFRLMDRFKSTFCWLPNFAFSYLSSQRARMNPCSIDHVRSWINCSEPVRRRSIAAFIEAFRQWGVTPLQCQASYGMAESVFAVTQTPQGAIPRRVPRSLPGRSEADRSTLQYDLLDDVYVSSGTTIPGAQVRVRKPDGSLAADEQCGGIEIRTEFLFAGHWGKQGFQEQSFTTDGWYVTGDYGFLSGNDLFVIGRSKDIVIVGGQNVFPEDVEMAAGSVAGVYPGRVVAFGVEDLQHETENLVVIAELRGHFQAEIARQMEREIQRVVLAAIGIVPRLVKVVPERWIVKSTSGKISRRETRLRFLQQMVEAPSLAREAIQQ